MKAILFDFDGLSMDTEVPVHEARRENWQELSLGEVTLDQLRSLHADFETN